jgi:hypothetical protein
MEKICYLKSFKYLVWTPFGKRVKIYFFSPFFATGVVDTGGKYSDLPPVSTTPVANFISLSPT